MRRLLYVISFTSQIEESKRFYRDVLGLQTGTDSPYWVDFATDGVGLALLAVNPGQVKGVELCFEAEDVERSMTTLVERGVAFSDELRRLAFGSVVHFRDPENNLLSLLQPSPAATEPSPPPRSGAMQAETGEPTGSQTMLALEPQTQLATGEPRLTAAIINALAYPEQRAFYKERLGLATVIESDWWTEFDTGPLALALRPRADHVGAPHAAQPVSFGFLVEDVNAWIEIAEERGLTFRGTPTVGPLGLTAEAVDPEGNVLSFREPGQVETLEEHLAEPFEDEVPHQVAMRKPVKKGSRAASRVALKPQYKAAKKKTATKKTATKKNARLKGRLKGKIAKPRGSGPVRSRAMPKQKRDPKRARSLPATGRQKKAERKTRESKKRAVAKASRGKPVKRAATKVGRARTTKRATSRTRAGGARKR